MAGSNADIATLTNDNAFIASVRAELIQKAVAVLTSAEGVTTLANIDNVRRAQRVLANGGEDAARLAANIAAGNATIAAAAPAVPSDGDVAFCVSSQFDQV